MKVKTLRLVIAGLSGDSGKTIVSLSLLAAMGRKGLNVVPFKKGPDYIDPAWLSTITGNVCRNLDTYLVDSEDVKRSFIRHASGADIAVIEGNRGLFDGKDLTGKHSTAGLAKLLQAPLILVVNATKATRTVAALVRGCQVFDPDLKIAGIILNKVAGPRHEKVIRESIEKYCDLPVLGAIPKLGKDASLLPGRHLGLVPPTEFPGRSEVEDKLVEIATNHLDLDKILASASEVEDLTVPGEMKVEPAKPQVRIGYFDDAVFTFYYPENLEALQQSGAKLVPVSSLADSVLPEIDALYIGGGFPETHARHLAENRSLMESVKSAADRGMPIYAECGGLIYLCRSLKWNDNIYTMADIFPIDLVMHTRPVGHGYTTVRVDQPNPFFEVGDEIKGHEFHYSGPISGTADISTCLSVQTGVGLGAHRDGLIHKLTQANYMHIHADGVKGWAAAMVAAAEEFAAGLQNDPARGNNRPAVNSAGMV
jgi:cobyrinic acid a,c-diamide synthase